MYVDRYVAAASRPKSACLYCPVAPSGEKLMRVISMSLYGSDRRYVVGAVRNAQLVPIVFPGWQIRFYCKSSTGQSVIIVVCLAPLSKNSVQ